MIKLSWIVLVCLLCVGLSASIEPPILQCFKCHDFVPGLDRLVNHFRHLHGLTVTATASYPFVCGQGSCVRNFERISSFRKHILKYHVANEDGVDEGGGNEGEGDGNEGNEPTDPLVDEVHMEVDEDEGNAQLPPPDSDAFLQALDLRSLCINLIAQLRAKTNVTGQVLKTVLEEMDSLLTDVTNNLKYELQKFLAAKNLLHDEDAQSLLGSFNIESPFKDLGTLDKQVKAIKEVYGLVESTEIPVGKRVDNRLNKESLLYEQVQVQETSQYVSIIDVLKLLMSSATFREAVKSEKPSPNGLISSFLDGQQYKCNAFLHSCDLMLRLQLYFDEVEIVNPLGSKTGIHKIGVFYYTIQNLPKHLNSSLDSIHVLAMFYDEDRKKYGLKKILDPFLYDLKKLEATGVSMNVDGEEIFFKATIAGFCGDGLAVHEVFELLGPSASKFCRLCLISRHDLHNGKYGEGVERTKAVHDNHLAMLKANPGNQQVNTDTGMSGDCVLHSSTFFHITRNFIFDVMHDILEGIGPFELKLVLHHYIYEEELLTVAEFNHRVKTFNYGVTEVKNKPSDNFVRSNLTNLKDHKIKQRAMQTWVLLRAFPFLLAGQVPSGDKYMNLILLLLRIMEIVFAPRISVTSLPYLAELIDEHHRLFLELFSPAIKMINKHHHLVHYPRCIREFGPLRDFWCMRYEGKHNILKKHAQVVCNFKNPPKTLVRICQFIQSNAFGRDRFKINRLKDVKGVSVLVERTLSREELVNLGYPLTKSVFAAKSLDFNGVEYRLQMVVALESSVGREDNLPLFGQIVEIVLINNSEVFLKTKVFKSLSFDPDFNAYRVAMRENHESSFVSVSSLADYKPVSQWTLYDPKRRFVSLRHFLV